MKKLFLFCLAFIVLAHCASAQCSSGTSCAINWDYLQFFPSAGISPYTTLATSQTQMFAFGTQTLTLTHNFTGTNASGTDGTNTAETGSFGAGDDVHFLGDGTITASFAAPVDNVKFSLYDIDYNQKVTITSSTGTVVTLTKIGGTSILTTAASGNSGSATAAATTAVANSSTDGTLNVNITGAVTNFSIVVTQTGTKTNGPPSGQENGDFWLSDISACSVGSFISNYWNVSKPYTNQGGYVLVSKNDSVFYTDPATGTAKFIFADLGTANINSLAYDPGPTRHYFYYARDATGAGGAVNPSNKTLYRYDYDADTLGPVIQDLTAFLPTFDAGVETGAAGFYDGSLYFGIDLSGGSSGKAIAWRITFNNSYYPTGASQVYAVDASGHDWGDFVLNNGTLYDFDGKSGSENYYHLDLYSKAVTPYTPSTGNLPKQTAIDWTGQLYSIGDASSTAPIQGMVVPYYSSGANAGTLNTALKKTITFNGTAITGQWRDGGEAFKPRVDFGDAPATYDPSGTDPAMHEISSLLYIGNSSSNEWTSRGQTSLANSDTYDDGLNIQSLVNSTTGSFYCSVKYLNNTGNTATICAWVDFNNNGVFDVGEGKMVGSLPSSSSSQSTFIYWNGMTTTLTPGQYTYVRVRITSTANGMTEATPTGFFNDGEVEDYRLLVTMAPLKTNLLSFSAVNEGGRARTNWQVTNEENGTEYTVQRSTDGANWENVNTQKAVLSTGSKSYSFADPLPWKSTVYYRLSTLR